MCHTAHLHLLLVAIVCAAEFEEKLQKAKAAAAAAANVMPASASPSQASTAAPKLPPGLKIPSMPKGWKPGMPIPGDLTCNTRCAGTNHAYCARSVHPAHAVQCLGSVISHECLLVMLVLLWNKPVSSTRPLIVYETVSIMAMMFLATQAHKPHDPASVPCKHAGLGMLRVVLSHNLRLHCCTCWSPHVLRQYWQQQT